MTRFAHYLILIVLGAMALVPQDVMAVTSWAEMSVTQYADEALIGLGLIAVVMVLDLVAWPFLTRG